MTTSRLGFVLTVTLAVAFTCTSSDTPSVIHLADDLALAFCKHQFRCCSPAEIGEVAGGRYSSESECLAFAKLSAEQQLALLDNAIRTGHITIAGSAAAACARKYETRACNTSLQLPETIAAVPNVAQALAACPGLMVGQVPAGSRCTIPEECASGTRCYAGRATTPGAGGFAGDPVAPPSSTGACVPVRGLGEICNESADCDPAARLYCKQPEFRCTPRARAGEPCSFDGVGLPTVECDTADNLACDFQRLQCLRPPRAGEPCRPFTFPQCDPDPALALFCNQFTASCMAAGNEGEMCGAAALRECRADLVCVPTQSDGIGTCGAPPGEGSPCNSKCASPTACDLASNVCRMPGEKPVGAACADRSECVTLACDVIAGITPLCVPSGRPVMCMGNSVTPGGNVNTGAGGKIMTGMGGFSGGFGTGGFSGAGAGGFSGAGAMTGSAGVSGAGGMAGGGI